jgi:hypothetical protein
VLLPKFTFEEPDDLADNRGKMPNARLFGGLETTDNCVGLFGLQLDDLVHDNFSFRGSTLTSSAMASVIVAFAALSEVCKSRQAAAAIGKIGPRRDSCRVSQHPPAPILDVLSINLRIFKRTFTGL